MIMPISTQNKINDINNILSEFGLPEVVILNPNDIVAQKKNARYFKPEKFQMLVENIKSAGSLKSAPLVFFDESIDKYRIIDGTHRVQGSKDAGLSSILCFLEKPESNDEKISKQLSYNALTGEDDKLILSELFKSITDIDLKFATGLSDELHKIEYTSLNFKLGASKQLTVMFLPEDIEEYDSGMNKIAEDLILKQSDEARVTSLEYWDKFIKIIQKVKKNENIKSNGSAILRLIELANEQINLDKIGD